METLLIFQAGDLSLAIDSDRVSRVQKVPVLTDVPLEAGPLQGIAVIDGRVVPVLDTGLLLGRSAIDRQADTARLMVVQLQQESIGLLVSAVAETVEVDTAALASADTDLPWVSGVFEHEGRPVQILSPDERLSAEMMRDFTPFRVDFPLPQGRAETHRDTLSETALYLLFRLGDEHFALDTEQVGELLRMPDAFMPLAGAPQPPVMGVSPLRGEMVTVVDLGARLGFGCLTPDAHTRLLVLNDAQGRQLAVAVPQVYEVMEVSAAAIRKVRCDADHSSGVVSGVFRAQEGQMVSVLSPLAVKGLIEQFALTETARSGGQKKQEGVQTMAELAVFRIGDEAYALDIEQVQEIIKYQPVTPIPEPPRFVEGIINLRGRVIPVINLPRRLGFDFTPTERSKIVVGIHGDMQVGFLVDEVEEILYVEADHVVYSEDPDSLIHATVTLDEGRRVILWLRLASVLAGITFNGIN